MANLFFFWGQEDFLINSEIEKLKSEYIDKTFETMAYKKLYNPSFDEVIGAVQSLPMMFGNIMHVIDVNKFFMSEGENSIEDWELKQFESALQNKSDKNIIVFRCIIPKESKKKVDTRKKIYKITSKYAQEKQFPIYKPYDRVLPDVISELGKQQGLKLNSQVINVIINQIGTNLGVINSELQKLALTIYPDKEPKSADIQNFCTQKDDVFTILEAIFNRNNDKALLELKKVLEKISIPEIMAAIQYSLRNYTLIKTYYNKLGKFATAQKLHLPENIIEKNYKTMSEITWMELLAFRKRLLNAEYSIKTGDCVNPEYTLEMALIGGSNV